MRYHFCLFSALQNIPFVAVKRSDKVADLCSDLEWPWGVEIDDVQVDELLDKFAMLKSDHGSQPAKLSQRSYAVRERALQNLSGLNEILIETPKVRSSSSSTTVRL
jgi:hypothetical protein